MTNWREARSIRTVLVAPVAIFALVGAGSAQAATVTVGSPLTAPPAGSFAGTATEANVTLGEPGALTTAPSTAGVKRWTIVSYRADVTGAGRLAIRVLRPAGGGAFTGAGSSAPATPVGTGPQTFDADLPIRPGDMVGLDLLDPGSSVRIANVVGSTIDEWGNNGFLAEGETALPKNMYGSQEIAFNAELTPTNEFGVGATRLNKRKGTATIGLKLPNPGTLAAGGKGVTATPARTAPTGMPVNAGPAKLLVKATGRKHKTLVESGSVKVRVSISYRPKLGDRRTASVELKLKKKT